MVAKPLHISGFLLTRNVRPQEEPAMWQGVFMLRLFSVLAWMLVVLATATPARAATFVDTARAPFGTFGGIDYIRYTGRFVGTTALGVYRMPFEIVAPVDPWLGNGTVLIEPPHFAFGPAGRDGVLGRAFLFSQGYSYASVGYGTFGLNILDPTAPDLVLAGEPVGQLGPVPVSDYAILVQFVHALEIEPFAVDSLGTIERKYGYGVSQSAQTWLVILHQASGQGLLDFTLLDRAVWRPAFAPPDVLALLPEEFVPLSGIGRVIFVESEADLLISGARQFRRTVVGPAADPENYAVYEIAGAPHFPLPPPFNPLAFSGVVRAMLLNGDRWVRTGAAPPPSLLLADAPEGAIDPVYGIETGIARDGDGNALGGVRFPDVEVGRAFFVASLPDFEIVPGFPGLVGAWFDLQCVPLADGSVRFPSHGNYVSRVVRQANSLRKSGYLLKADADALKAQAAESEVGLPKGCGP
ncbi:MAG TPA: alpha/beta hydrolase domain-containing protein [Thermoanaerobaculia bacterium]|nr:alpha/beta hydrolase domain-containing protein [Thermoanaerobaculia bacterium]